MKFYTIEIDDVSYDLPKNMPVPQKGSHVAVNEKYGIVDFVCYSVFDNKLFSINIFCKKTTKKQS